MAQEEGEASKFWTMDVEDKYLDIENKNRWNLEYNYYSWYTD